MNPKPQQRDILAAFLKEKLTEAGLECDDKTLALINKALLLGEREPIKNLKR